LILSEPTHWFVAGAVRIVTLSSALIVAVIAGVVALTSAGIAAWSQVKVKSLEQSAKENETRSNARIVLDRYRGPLLDAAWDLGDRLDNILDRRFLSSFETAPRDEVAISSTLFRLAQYFGWAEIVRREVQLLRFESAADTRRSAYFLSLVMRRFATDWYDWDEAREQAARWITGYRHDQLPPRHLMLWQEEQRGIGERMIPAATDARCIGYASFLDQYAEGFSRLLADFESGLRVRGVENSLRLVEVRDALARLVQQLDEEQRYVTGQPGYRTWLDNTLASACWDAYEHPNEGSGSRPIRPRA
jgi:hypothetical protein